MLSKNPLRINYLFLLLLNPLILFSKASSSVCYLNNSSKVGEESADSSILFNLITSNLDANNYKYERTAVKNGNHQLFKMLKREFFFESSKIFYSLYYSLSQIEFIIKFVNYHSKSFRHELIKRLLNEYANKNKFY